MIASILNLPVEVLQMVLTYCTLNDLIELARTCSFLARLVSQALSSRAFWESRFSSRYSFTVTPSPSEPRLCSASVVLRFSTPDYSGCLQSDNFYWPMMQIPPSVEGFLRGLSSKLLSLSSNEHKLILL